MWPSLLWGAINIAIVLFAILGRRSFLTGRGGQALVGAAVLMAANGVVLLVVLPAYFASNSKYVGATTDGTTLFLVHEVGGKSHTYVLEPWDLDTGTRLSRTVPSIFAFDPYRVVLRTGSRVWMQSRVDGLHVRDLRTAKVVLAHADLLAKVPLLGGADEPYSVDDAICADSPDGYTLRFDPASMTAARLAVGGACSSSASGRDPPRDPLDLTSASRGLTSASRGQVIRGGSTSRVPLDPDHSWLAACWVKSGHRAQQLDDPPSLLMTYLADGDHVPMLARMAVESGRALWTRQTGTRTAETAGIERAIVVGDGLLVITRTELTMLDAAHGNVRWSHGY